MSMKFVFLQPFIQNWTSVAFPLKKVCWTNICNSAASIVIHFSKHEIMTRREEIFSSLVFGVHDGKAWHDMAPLWHCLTKDARQPHLINVATEMLSVKESLQLTPRRTSHALFTRSTPLSDEGKWMQKFGKNSNK